MLLVFKKVFLTTALAFIFVVFSFGSLAHADNGEDHEQTDVPQNSQDLSEAKRQEMQQRLEARKAALSLRLSNAEKTRLQNRCKAAQGHLSATTNRIKGVKTSHDNVYGKLIVRLESLSAKLSDNGVDTVDLDANIIALKEKTDLFNDKLADYIQILEDLMLMQCQEDVEAFKASLEQARDAHKELREINREIRVFIHDTIKQTLISIKEQLNDDDSSEAGQEDN